MKNSIVYFAVFILSLVRSSFVFAQGADQLYPVSLNQRIQNATVIAEGKVVSMQGFWDADHKNIFTSNIIEVSRYLKGGLTTDQIEVITQGGTVGLQMEIHSAALKIGVGQTGIFFCMPHHINSAGRMKPDSVSFWVYSGPQGFIEYDLKERKASDPFTEYPAISTIVSNITDITHEEKRLNSFGNLFRTGISARTLVVPTVTGFSPTSISAGTSSVLTITGTNFNAVRGTGYVEFKNATNGGSGWMQPLPSDYISWTDNQIQVMVPSTNTSGGNAGSGQIRVTNSDASTATSVSSLTITYSYTNVAYALDGTNYYAYRPDHVNTNGAGGYTIQYNTTLASNSATTAAFKRAMTQWSCNTGMNWTIGANTSASGAGTDGINAISFSGSLNAGTLASTASHYSGCISGGNLVWYVTEIDMEFNNTYTWNYSTSNASAGQIDFESVTVHELGHAHQLNHVINSTRVMHYAIGAGVTLRSLTTDDITGGNTVKANSIVANACGNTSPMTTITCSQALPVNLLSFSGLANNGNNKLIWLTGQESNLKEFELQTSLDGINFHTMATFAAKGNGSGASYTSTDYNPTAGQHSYRLKIIDNDSRFTFSDVVILKTDAPGGIIVSGNPIKNSVTVTLPQITEAANIHLVDALGRNIVEKIVLPTSANVIQLDVPAQLPKGLYILEVVIGSKKFTEKLLKD